MGRSVYQLLWASESGCLSDGTDIHEPVCWDADSDGSISFNLTMNCPYIQYESSGGGNKILLLPLLLLLSLLYKRIATIIIIIII